MAGYLTVFQSLQDQLIMLENINTNSKHSFSNMKTLKSMPKRVLFGFMSGILGYLFGTLSSSDLNRIRGNINMLAKSHLLMSYTLERKVSQF